PEDDHFYFTKGFCTHPTAVNKFILNEVKSHKKADPSTYPALQLELIRMFFKMEQYSHLKFDQVYTRESKVRF
ncbi:MAG: hypothetical protein AAF203_07680, partial [Pseudomonadota bacterium]